MISIFNGKLIEVLFSGAFSMFIVMQLHKLISNFTNDVVFVILFIIIASYVYKGVTSE